MRIPSRISAYQDRTLHHQVHSEEMQMTKRTQILLRPSALRARRIALLGTVAAASLLLAADKPAADPHREHARLAQTSPAKLVQVVRDSTRQFTDVNVATSMN